MKFPWVAVQPLSMISTLTFLFHQVDSSFRGKTSGGSTKWPTSMNNPQFALDVKPLPNGIAQQTASIQFTLTGPHEIPFNLKLVRARGERVIE